MDLTLVNDDNKQPRAELHQSIAKAVRIKKFPREICEIFLQVPKKKITDTRLCGEICAIDHFTFSCLVAWPLNESEAGVDLVLIETLLLFICKFLLISMRTASLT